MKRLFLVRHAKSSWKYPELEDFERPLNRRGRQSALLMGKILKKLDAAPELLISSPANRAAATARIIAEAIHYPLEKIQYRESIYASGENELMHFIEDINDSVNLAMLVGHNPGLTDLVNRISDRQIANIPTCGVCCVDLDISSWTGVKRRCGKLRFFEFPKKNAPA